MGDDAMVEEKNSRVTLVVLGLGVFSLKNRDELNIAWSAGAGQAMVRHTKQPWQKH